MGSRFFKSLFFSSSNNNSLKSGSGAYDSTVALEPPLRGSYPVAGNGPNVEETLQRARAKREAKQNENRTNSIVNNIVSRAPSIARTRGEVTQAQGQRPKTAPHNGEPGAHVIAPKFDDERTRSGFSMKSPPKFFSNRRSSLRSAQSPPPVETLPPVPTKPAGREIPTYQPTKGPTPGPTPSNHPEVIGFTPPFAQKQHHRNFSRSSQSSHVDVLDAYSNIRGKEVSTQRTKASGVRDYGEDVADRNIADFGEPKLDLSSPEFGYLKSVYAQKKRQAGDDVAQHKTSQISKNDGDDTEPRTHGRIRPSTAPKSGVVSPLQNDSASRGHDDHTFDPTEQRSQALSPFSFTSTPKPDTPPLRNPRRKDSDPIDLSALPRGRQIRGTAPIVLPQRLSSLVPGPPRVVSPVQESPRSASFTTSPRINSPAHTRQSSKTANHRSTSQQNQRSISRNSSVTYSAFPNTSPPPEQTSSFPSRPTANRNKRSYTMEGAKGEPNLDGIVDLRNTVDTDVTTKTLPAVTHEHVKPIRHEHHQEKINREIHTHDIFHRVLPIIDTEVLPTKHYVHAPDGKSLVEVPESQLPGRTRSGSASRNWKIIETPLGKGDQSQHQHQKTSNHLYNLPQTTLSEEDSSDDAAEPPVVGLARGESMYKSKTASRSRANSRSSMPTIKSSRPKSIFDPILSSKRESISADGGAKNEYLWRHHPQFENYSRPNSSLSHNPVYIGAGIGDISPEGSGAVKTISNGRDFYFSDDTEGERSSDERKAREGEELLFRDSGYGSGGGLPGIQDGNRGLIGDFDRMRLGHVAKRSAGSGEVLVERDDESDEMIDDKFRNANRKLREIRERRSRSNLRGSAQDVERR